MTQQAVIQENTAAEEAPQCMHYWVIQPADGPVSPGVCQTCGETREFKNYVEGAAWGDSRLSNRSTGEEAKAISRGSASDSDGAEPDDE